MCKQMLATLFHPDFTVGAGFTPARPRSRGSWTCPGVRPRNITTGRELAHRRNTPLRVAPVASLTLP